MRTLMLVGHVIRGQRRLRRAAVISPSPQPAADDAAIEPPAGIGNVDKGSLEEAIWRDLGALPTSRR